MRDERIGRGRGEAYALQTRDGTVLVDPEPLSKPALARLTDVVAICLTIQSHQRSSWRYRRHFEAPVWAPRDAQGLEATPDNWYAEGDRLPGGLVAIATPGPAFSEHALLAEVRGRRVLFLGDLVVRGDRGGFHFVEDRWMDAPDQARVSLGRVLSLRPDVLCPGHGAPALRDGTALLGKALERDRRTRPRRERPQHAGGPEELFL